MQMNRSNTKPDRNPARRTFLKQAGMGVAAAMGLPAVLSSCTGTDIKGGKINDFFSEGDVILGNLRDGKLEFLKK